LTIRRGQKAGMLAKWWVGIPVFLFRAGWHLESMGEVYAANLSDRMITVTPQEPPYFTAETLVINQKATEIG